MDTLDLLQQSVDFIEQRLDTELTLVEVAYSAGYSVYHYCRLFHEYMHAPVAAYITKRRLQYVLYAAKQGLALTDAAMLYGFDTHAGFYKACKREYGCSPSWLLRHGTVSRPERVIISKEAAVMLTQTQIRKLLLNWDVDNQAEIGDIELAGGTIISDSAWTIGDYVLKAVVNRSNALKHIRIARALDAQGLNAGVAIAAKTGENFIELDGRDYLLMKRVPGRMLLPDERYHGAQERLEIGKKYGAAIAHLHQALRAADDQLEFDDVSLMETVTGWALPETKKTMEQWGCPLPDEFYEEYEKEFKVLYPKLPRQAIHRDPNPSNILFDHGEVSGFVDFEICERNVRLFDPCYCATGTLSEAGQVEGGYSLWPELLKGILSGYNSVSPLTKEEKQAIPYVIYSIQMIFITWLNNQPLYRKIASENREMLCWIWNHREQCFKNLLVS